MINAILIILFWVLFPKSATVTQPAEPTACVPVVSITPTPVPTPKPVLKPIITPEPEVLAADSLLTVVNRVRAENGCNKPLKANAKLTQAAQERASYIADGHWSHDGYDKTVQKYYKYRYLGENLARDFNSDEAIVNAWLKSEAHRAVLLNCTYVETGIGRSGSYVAQEYGKR